MINVHKFFQNISGFLKKVLIVELIILILTGLFWWFTGPHTKERFVNVLFVVGAIAIVIGFLIRTGSREGTYDLSYHYFRTFGSTPKDERIKQDMADMEHSYLDFIVLFTGGIIAFILSILIDMTF
jgi:hypothetical protein